MVVSLGILRGFLSDLGGGGGILNADYHQGECDELAKPAPNDLMTLIVKLCQIHTHTIHAWYIYLHLVDFYGKCR